MKRMLLFSGSSGLNTVVDPVRHKYDPDLGIADLVVAKNVDFDQTGRLSNRKGWQYTAVTSSCHSLFCDGGACLFVTGNALSLLEVDFTTTALRNVTVGARMSYAQVGNKIYYTNGREIGFVRDNVSVSWSKPSTVYHVKDSTKVLSGPPTGSLLEYFNGRMYIIQSSTAWESEQYNVNAYDLAKNFLQMEAPISMFKGVTDGIWVGTRTRIAFLRGSHIGNFKYELKGLFGVVPGTATKVDSLLIGDGSIPEVGVIFVTKYGPCLGTFEGKLIPLTNKKISVPNAVRGTGAIINKKYVFCLEP